MYLLVSVSVFSSCFFPVSHRNTTKSLQFQQICCIIKSCKRYFRYTRIAFTSSKTYTGNRHILYPFTVPPKIRRWQRIKMWLPSTDTEARADPMTTFSGSCSSTSSVKDSPGNRIKLNNTLNIQYFFQKIGDPLTPERKIPPKLTCRNMYFW